MTFLRTGEVARRLGISSQTVRVMVARGQLTATQIGRQLKVHEESVLNLIQAKGVPNGHTKEPEHQDR